MVASESLKIDDKNWRDVVDLDLFDGLLVIKTPVAVPCVRLRQLFWPIELPEAVIDADTF